MRLYIPSAYRQETMNSGVSIARPRPPGRGAFHDFVLAAYLAKPVRTRRNGFRRTTRWQLRDPDAAVGRWYGEGGNTQNAMMRSLRTSPTSST